MLTKSIKTSILFGALSLGLTVKEAQSAGTVNDTLISTLSGTVTVPTLLQLSENASTTVSNLIFTPAGVCGVVDVNSLTTAATTLTSPVFSAGAILRLSNTTTVPLILNAPSFTQNLALPYIVLDGAGAILNFTGTPTFTGTGWIEINQNSTLINGTSGTLTISAPVRIASGATLTVTTNAHTVEFGGGVTGAGTLTIGDTGTVQFDATSTFATLNPGSSAILLNSAASLAANMILSQATTIDVIATGTATATVSGVISGAFRLTKGGNNSTLSLTALNTFSGGLTVTGGSVSGSAPSAFGTSGIALSATSSSNPATLKPTATMTIPNSITVPANDYGAVSIPSGVTLTPSGAVTLGASSSLTLSGSGAIVLQAATTAPSTSSINLTGVTTSLMLGASLGSAGITVATASTLSSLSNFTGANAITNAFTVSAPLTITGPINTTTTLTGLITASASSIIKTGAGTVVIVPAAGNTANNISALSLQGGTLQLINTNADPIGTSCAVTQSPNTTLISPAQATTMTPGVGVSSAVTVSVN